MWDVKKLSRQQHEAFRKMTECFKVLSHMCQGSQMVLIDIAQDQSRPFDQRVAMGKLLFIPFLSYLFLLTNSMSLEDII